MYSYIYSVGGVSLAVYWWYIRALFIPLFILFLLLFAAYEGLAIFANIWLSNMSDDENIKNDAIAMFIDRKVLAVLNASLANAKNPKQQAAIQAQIDSYEQNYTTSKNDLYYRRDQYLWWYLGYGGFQAILVLAFGLVFTFMVANASRFIHSEMIGIKYIFAKPTI